MGELANTTQKRDYNQGSFKEKSQETELIRIQTIIVDSIQFTFISILITGAK